MSNTAASSLLYCVVSVASSAPCLSTFFHFVLLTICHHFFFAVYLPKTIKKQRATGHRCTEPTWRYLRRYAVEAADDWFSVAGKSISRSTPTIYRLAFFDVLGLLLSRAVPSQILVFYVIFLAQMGDYRCAKNINDWGQHSDAAARANNQLLFRCIWSGHLLRWDSCKLRRKLRPREKKNSAAGELSLRKGRVSTCKGKLKVKRKNN